MIATEFPLGIRIKAFCAPVQVTVLTQVSYREHCSSARGQRATCDQSAEMRVPSAVGAFITFAVQRMPLLVLNELRRSVY